MPAQAMCERLEAHLPYPILYSLPPPSIDRCLSPRLPFKAEAEVHAASQALWRLLCAHLLPPMRHLPGVPRAQEPRLGAQARLSGQHTALHGCG
ncbi:unnamed protein product [Closterium sp. NIES-54]